MIFLRITLVLLFSALFCCVKCEDDKYLITLVYRFVFANEALCGDPFADPEWVPAANDCFVDCDPTLYMCMIHMETSIQKCKFFSKECQSAIRKHLGWSSSIVSVYRPMPVSSSDQHHSDNTVIDNVFRGSNEDTISHKPDRLAVEAVEKIERDLMGLPSIALSPVDHKIFPSLRRTIFSGDLVWHFRFCRNQSVRADEISLAIDAMTSSPSHEWLKAPGVENNGYSAEDTASFASKPPLRHHNVPPEAAEHYENARSNRIQLAIDDKESPHRERLLHTAENAPVLINYELPHPLSSQPSSTHLSAPQPPAPEPSPPAFSPYYPITTSLSEQNVLGVMTPAPHNSKISPKVIDFLDRLATNEEMEPLSLGSVPHPPGYRPFDSGCANNANSETSNGIRNKLLVLEDLEATTRNSHSMKSYIQMGMVPYSEQIGVLDTTSSSGFDEATTSRAARFEVFFS
ncbi:unnamed protein product [Angiostrongylus costaricensis]|uniref:ShKT domain-containing protein n=1 Tax=Angiostrongylus costaricensis TaxID=334426 RepID=A0A0R3PFH6_ANGCS|nr:unnamed protein product [Angiostrongylus costaricensis]